MQLISYSTQDITLTGNPEITFFNIIYRRYTNFGKKIISLSFDNSPEFNSFSYINIPKNNGDLLSKSFLRIKLPYINFDYINSVISEKISEYYSNQQKITFSYYNYFLDFINKLKNIIRNFFIKYDYTNNLNTYIQDLKINIQKYLNINEYTQFFIIVDYFFNNINVQNNLNKYNTELYTNASLFKIKSNTLIYIYEMFNNETLSYDGFKFCINKNISLLDELNAIIYDKIYTNFTKNYLIKFCWVNKVAVYLFNSIEFYIGSNKIYELSDSYINNYAELYYKNKDLYNRLIGNNTWINEFSDKINEEILYLPIPFWDLSNYGLSFPLISLQFNSLQIRINTKKFLDCIRINYDKNIFDENLNNLIIDLLLNYSKSTIITRLEITLLAEFIYLDSIERNKFARSAHEYLIQQVQEIEFNKISSTNNTIQLDIFHCCKDMFWFAQKVSNQFDIFDTNINVFDYTYKKNKIVLPTNLVSFINYILVVNSPFVLFEPNTYLNGLNVLYNNINLYSVYFKIINLFINKQINPFDDKSFNPIILESYFNLNGVQLIGENYKFFNYLHPYIYYNSTPQSGFNVYSFCLKPTEFQPSGSCNMSRISYIGLKLKIINKPINPIKELFSNDIDEFNNSQINNADEYKLIFQTRNFNVLRFIGGIGATAYTY